MLSKYILLRSSSCALRLNCIHLEKLEMQNKKVNMSSESETKGGA